MTAPLCDSILEVDELEPGTRGARTHELVCDRPRRSPPLVPLPHLVCRAPPLRARPIRSRTRLPNTSAEPPNGTNRTGTSPCRGFRCAHESSDLELAGRIVLALGGRAHKPRRDRDPSALAPRMHRRGDRRPIPNSQSSRPGSAGFSASPTGQNASRAAASVSSSMCAPRDGATSLRSTFSNLRAVLAPAGVHQMLIDAEFVCAAETGAANPRWLLAGSRAIGNANLLLGRPDEAVAAFRRATRACGREAPSSHSSGSRALAISRSLSRRPVTGR